MVRDPTHRLYGARRVDGIQRRALIWPRGSRVRVTDPTRRALAGRSQGPDFLCAATPRRRDARESSRVPSLPGFLHKMSAVVVQRADGRATRLRRAATSRPEWTRGECVLVANGEPLVVLRREGSFAWVRTAKGKEGYIKSEHVAVAAAACAASAADTDAEVPTSASPCAAAGDSCPSTSV